tara:strand:+ start:629 stop:1051 length:423 start_codon:yes stop_codon:yes gene_type:complete
MNNSMRATKVNIAKDFVALHKEFDIPLGGGDDGFADIYVSLEQEYFGTTELVDELTGEFEIEIPGHQTTSGNSILFNFIEPDFFENRLSEFFYFEQAKLLGFTDSEILDSLEDGEVLDGISEDDAEEMHHCLTQLIKLNK